MAFDPNGWPSSPLTDAEWRAWLRTGHTVAPFLATLPRAFSLALARPARRSLPCLKDSLLFFPRAQAWLCPKAKKGNPLAIDLKIGVGFTRFNGDLGASARIDRNIGLCSQSEIVILLHKPRPFREGDR